MMETNQINIGNYKPGVYIIKTKDSKGNTYINKIVKEY